MADRVRDVARSAAVFALLEQEGLDVLDGGGDGAGAHGRGG